MTKCERTEDWAGLASYAKWGLATIMISFFVIFIK